MKETIFQPPDCGKIISKSSKRKYHHFAEKRDNPDGLCDWYWVKCVNCIFPILIPETCIKDLAESIKKDKRMFVKMGVPDLFDKQRKSYEGLKNYQYKKESYLLQ